MNEYTFLGYYEALLLKAECSQGWSDLQSSYCLPNNLSALHRRWEGSLALQREECVSSFTLAHPYKFASTC